MTNSEIVTFLAAVADEPWNRRARARRWGRLMPPLERWEKPPQPFSRPEGDDEFFLTR